MRLNLFVQWHNIQTRYVAHCTYILNKCSDNKQPLDGATSSLNIPSPHTVQNKHYYRSEQTVQVSMVACVWVFVCAAVCVFVSVPVVTSDVPRGASKDGHQ